MYIKKNDARYLINENNVKTGKNFKFNLMICISHKAYFAKRMNLVLSIIHNLHLKIRNLVSHFINNCIYLLKYSTYIQQSTLSHFFF